MQKDIHVLTRRTVLAYLVANVDIVCQGVFGMIAFMKIRRYKNDF